MVRDLGTRNVVLRLNEEARTAIPRQIKLADFMPKLDLLVYERERVAADEELERLWNIYFDNRLGEDEERFLDLSAQLNDLLDQDSMPKEEDKRNQVGEVLDQIEALLGECEFGPEEIEAVFRIKAFPEVLAFYLERRGQAQAEA
jgi:hypothetical protein